MSLNDEIRTETAAGVVDALKPYLRRLADPEALTYTGREAAAVIGCSARKIEQWVADGTLPRVPNIGTVLVPRIAVEAYIFGADPHEAIRRAADVCVENLRLVNAELRQAS